MKIKKCCTAVITALITATLFCAATVSCGERGDEKNPPHEIPYNAFYDADNWETMTNNSGASLDTGEKPVSLYDGSIRFFRANQAYELGDKSNDTVSFLLKATHDFSIWLNSSSKDNGVNNSYRLVHADNELSLVVSDKPNEAAAVVSSTYESGQWNRFDIDFITENNVTRIVVNVNDEPAALSPGKNISEVKVENDILFHYAPESFKTGGWFAVKVWDACDYVQLKPVELAVEADVPIVAVIGDSITEGSGVSNSYIDSYPSQMQKMLGKDYNVINFGKSGRTARTDLPSDGSAPVGWLDNLQWQGVKAIVPDIAIINIGTNDSKTSLYPKTTAENFKEAYERIIDEVIKVNPKTKIYLCTSAYAYSSDFTINNGNIESIIVPVQKQVAEERGYPIIDIHEITKNKSALFPDGIHPNSKGYTMLAEVFTKVIKDGVSSLTSEFLDDVNTRYNDEA